MRTFSTGGISLVGEGDEESREGTEEAGRVEVTEFETEDLAKREHESTTQEVILDERSG